MKKNQFLAQRMIRQEISGKIAILRPELLKYYGDHEDDFIREEQVFLREIVISLTGTNAAERARDILGRVKRGEKFPELARDVSDGKSSANFRAVSWIKKEGIRPELKEEGSPVTS